MHSWLTRALVSTVAMASLAGPSIALAGTPKAPHRAARTAQRPTAEHHARGARDGTETGTESAGADTDGARQAAACQKAGVDPNGANVNYDDQTGACTANGGGNQQH